MRLARIGSAPALVREASWTDVATSSQGRFADEDSVFEQWPAFTEWAAQLDGPPGDRVEWKPLDGCVLQAPRSRPRQVFGAGLNYHSHLAEAGRDVPAVPLFFTKFPSAISDPDGDVLLATDAVDFEAELVVVLGRDADRVEPEDAWTYVAGLTAGQDYSARDVQRSGQLSLGKSFRTFAPIGPWIVTPDEFDDPTDLGLRCEVDGEVLQEGRTGDMVFDVAQLLALLSAITTLYAGDLIFTGTCSGVGVFREPRRFLREGDVVHTWVEGIGDLRNRCRALTEPNPAQQTWSLLHPIT